VILFDELKFKVWKFKLSDLALILSESADYSNFSSFKSISGIFFFAY